MPTPSSRFRSLDGRFELVLGSQLQAELLEHCEIAGRSETGGILVGNYSPDGRVATVTKVLGPPRDSRAGHTYFHRGTSGLQRTLDRLWRAGRRHFYLGEWHHHPGGPAIPSGTDDRQLETISRDEGYSCPEPVLLIVGGGPPAAFVLSVYVYPRSVPRVELHPESTATGDENWRGGVARLMLRIGLRGRR